MMEHQQEIATPDKRNTNARTVRSQKLTFGTTKWLTYTAVFAALAIVMKFIGQFLTLTPNFRITLIYTIWLIAAAVLGVFGGAAVCFVSDVLGAMIIPVGPMNPYLIIGNLLYGITAALVFRYLPIKSYVIKFIASGLACTLICTCIANSLALYYSNKYYETLTFCQYFAAFRALQPVVALINVAVTVAMIPLLTRLKLLPPLKRTQKSSEKVICPTSL